MERIEMETWKAKRKQRRLLRPNNLTLKKRSSPIASCQIMSMPKNKRKLSRKLRRLPSAKKKGGHRLTAGSRSCIDRRRTMMRP